MHSRNFLATILLPMACILGCQVSADTISEEPVEVRRSVKIEQVGTKQDAKTCWWPGRAKATREVNLSFRVAGPLVEGPVDVGVHVRKGDVLARIDPRDFEVALRNVEAKLLKAKATLYRAQQDYKRISKVKAENPGATSAKDVDRNREVLDLAKAEIRSLEAMVDAAKDRLRYTHVVAPFDGTVVATYVENYEYVQAREEVIRLLDISRIEMTVDIPENLICQMPHAEEICVRFDAFSDCDVKARVKEMGAEASEMTRTYPVTLIMDQPKDFEILPGMAGMATWKAILPSQKGLSRLKVPSSALFSPQSDGNLFVWIFDRPSNTVKRRNITVDPIFNDDFFVKGGLESGEWIVTAGVHYLEDGDLVRPLVGGFVQ